MIATPDPLVNSARMFRVTLSDHNRKVRKRQPDIVQMVAAADVAALRERCNAVCFGTTYFPVHAEDVATGEAVDVRGPGVGA